MINAGPQPNKITGTLQIASGKLSTTMPVCPGPDKNEGNHDREQERP